MSSKLWNCPLQEEETRAFFLQLPSFMDIGLLLGSTPTLQFACALKRRDRSRLDMVSMLKGIRVHTLLSLSSEANDSSQLTLHRPVTRGLAQPSPENLGAETSSWRKF